MVKYIAIGLFLLVAISFAQRDKFNITEPLIVDGIYHFGYSGDYDYTTYETVKAVLEKYRDKDVVFHVRSHGGNADRIIEIMDLIHVHGRVHWVVSDNSYCYSACAWSGIAAASIRGRMNFHGVRLNTGKLQSVTNIQLQLRAYRYGYEFNRSAKWIQADFYEEVFE